MSKSGDVKISEKQAFDLAKDLKLDGNSVYETGDYDKALLKYELAIQTAPDAPISAELRSVCFANRAACFSNMGKFEESVEECTKALELNPTYAKALLRRGEAREKLERYDESIADMTQILLELDPSNDQAMRNIVRLRLLADKKRENLKYGMMGDTRGVDYISTLHEDISTCILLRLPFKEAVRTSILSKAWELRWTSLCNVRIDDFDNDLDLMSSVIYLSSSIETEEVKAVKEATFANFVDRVLRVSNNVKSFYLATRNGCTPSLLTKWISTVLSSKVEKLYVYFLMNPSYDDKAIVFPFKLLNSPSLCTFKMSLFCTFNLDAMNYFPNLTILFLQNVCLNGDSNTTLSLSFPLLETFETLNCQWVNVNSVEIHVPALAEFSTDPYTVNANYSIKVIAPRLAKFQNYGLLPENIDFGGSPVVTAHFGVSDFVYDLDLVKNSGQRLRKQMNGLYSNLNELALSEFMAKALQSGGYPIQHFRRLTRLLLLFSCKIEQLFEFLHATPTLKYLYIDLHSIDYYDYDSLDSIPSCIVSHLEEVATCSFRGLLGQETFLKFFIENGEQLKQLMFVAGLDKGNTVTYGLVNEERMEVLELLAGHSRKSKAPLRFFFPNPDKDYFVR